MNRENLVESGAKALSEIYRSGVSYRKVRTGAAVFAKEIRGSFSEAEANLIIGALDSAILRGEANAGKG